MPLQSKLDDLEANYDAQFKVAFDAIRALMEAASVKIVAA
jgi:hypothetical protein